MTLKYTAGSSENWPQSMVLHLPDCLMAEKLEEEARLEQWLKAGSHGKMHYMENHFDKRVDPTLLVPGAKSVISLMYNYIRKKNLQLTTN